MEGYKPWSRRQTFASGARVELKPELAKLATPPSTQPTPTPSEVSPNADDDLRIRDLLKAYAGAMQDKDVALVRHLYPNITDKERNGLTGAFHDADSIQMSLDDCKHDPVLGRTQVEVTCRQTFSAKAGGVLQPPRVNTAFFTLQKLKTGDWVIYKASVR